MIRKIDYTGVWRNPIDVESLKKCITKQLNGWGPEETINSLNDHRCHVGKPKYYQKLQEEEKLRQATKQLMEKRVAMTRDETTTTD